VETVYVFIKRFGQGAKTVMEEAFAFTKEYEHDASIVKGLKCALTKEEESRALFAKINVKQPNVP
jgi:hypothetical protein